MSDINRMYELEYPSPEVTNGSSDGPALIIALQGYADAGHAVDGAARHVKAALESHPVVSFNNDELIDYRSRRPAVTLQDDHLDAFSDLQLDLRVLRDNKGTSFLLLSGPEPDFRWEAFTTAVADLADKYGVSQTLCLYASPMQVPHTRPMVVLAHGNSPDLVDDLYTWDARVTVPGAASLYIERELHKRGHKVGGYTAQVPHYLAQSPYPTATYQLLTAVSEVADLDFPLRSLEQDIKRAQEQLAEHTAGSHEIAQVVQAFEQQYDAELERYRAAHPDARLPGEAKVPSSDEIGAEFERFLASMAEEDSPEENSAGGDGTPSPSLTNGALPAGNGDATAPNDSPEAEHPEAEDEREED
ncbi:MAG TPA: PAC2 family protein [Corynebacterium sp.]|nr:PAC2 family protein [Corynebacterium sp.]